MEYSYYEQYINKKTKGRYDITPLFEDPTVFSRLINDLSKPFKDSHIDKIAGLEALGFVIGGALAQKLKTGFISIRKGGKLPGINGVVLSLSFVDYTGKPKALEVNKTAVTKGDEILMVDDWIETGSQMKTAIKLIEELGGKIIGISSICSEKNKQTQVLFDKYNLKAIKVLG